jgi:hypothetical protein
MGSLRLEHGLFSLGMPISHESILRVRSRMSWMSDPAEEQISHSEEDQGFGDVEVCLSAEGTISATANCIGCVLLRGRRRRSSHFEGSGQNLTRIVAAGASAAAGGREVGLPPERASLGLRCSNAGTGAGKARPLPRNTALQGLLAPPGRRLLHAARECHGCGRCWGAPTIGGTKSWKPSPQLVWT